MVWVTETHTLQSIGGVTSSGITEHSVHWRTQTMYTMDRYKAYNDHLVPAIFERWTDPEMHFRGNDSLYRNESKQRNDYTINDNIYKSNETTTNNTKIVYNLSTATTATASANYMFIPYFGAMEPNAAVPSPPPPMIWHQPIDLKHPIGSYLSSDATPFIPTTKPKACKYFLPFILV